MMMPLIQFFLFSLYRWLLIPLALFLLNQVDWLFKLLNFSPHSTEFKKLLTMIDERRDKHFQALPARPIWIHAASGEIEYAKSVIRNCKERFPQAPILVTYFSPSAKKLIQKFPGVDLVLPLPWDHRQSVKRFLDFYNPRCLLIARTDLWPELLWQCHGRKIPSLLFAATFSRKLSEKSWLSKCMTQFTLDKLQQILCVSRIDLDHVSSLTLSANLQVGGDTRYDQVEYRRAHPTPMKTGFHKPTSNKKILALGSTWPEDEKKLLSGAVQNWLRDGGLIIWAPHEVNDSHLRQLTESIGNPNIIARYSQINTWNVEQHPILLVDQVGHLHEFYSWAHCAFVGGSFKAKVHSVMEPLSLGLPVVVGPFHSNNREAVEFQNLVLSSQLNAKLAAVNVAHDEHQLDRHLQNIKKIDTPNAQILQKIQHNLGATEQVLKFIDLNIFQH